MPNGDDKDARRWPLPHERMVPIAERDEARAIARRLATMVRLFVTVAPSTEYEAERVLRDFDALPWAKEMKPPPGSSEKGE
jgi:hypothetical protein